MTVLISEDFDSYSNGDSLLSKNGGSGWGGAYNASTNAEVSNVQFVSSPNSALLFNNFFKRPLSLSGFFTFSFSFYITSTSGSMNLGIDGSALNPQEIEWTLTSSGASARWVNDFALLNQTVSANTWNKFDMEIDTSVPEFRARINSGSWSAWTPAPSAISSTFTRIYCQSNTGAAGYMDNIEFTDSPLPVIPNDLIQTIIF